jgi:hypothetical protein
MPLKVQNEKGPVSLISTILVGPDLVEIVFEHLEADSR